LGAIVYLTCPGCGNTFYIIAEFYGKGHRWFCPRCGMNFGEEESGSRSPGRHTAGDTR
jgi:uncharacterized C2H2 Zn-finger protein